MAWIDAQLGRLTPAQKLAHRLLVLPGIDSGGPDAETRRALEAGVGVLHSVRDVTASVAARYHNRVAEICADAGVPPALISGNLESGVAYSLGTSGTHFPYPRGIGLSGDTDLAYQVAYLGAVEARSLGYHWTFSPCADVVSVPDDPILGVRAYGVPAAETAELTAAQVRGYQDGGLLATAKHFPGHGDSSVDSHLDLPRIDRGRDQHETVHLPPFRAAVAAGVASIMVAHVELPALGVDEPATLSPVVNRGWLRSDLGFDGLIVTDSLRMAAVGRRHDPGHAALLALRAGADIANVKCEAGLAPRILEYLLAALADGLLDEAELDESVGRLLLARERIGLDSPAPVDEEHAAALDEGRAWSDPRRARTASHHPAGGIGPAADGALVVVGDSALARRIADLGTGLGWDPEPLRPGALERVAARHPAATLLPVFCPGTVPVDEQRAAVSAVMAAADASYRIAAVVVNSADPAESFAGLAERVVTTPAVDAFGILNDAAVLAATDVLGR